MRYKLFRRDFEIWKNEFYILPAFKVVIDSMFYNDRNFSIEFHFLTLHARLLWLRRAK